MCCSCGGSTHPTFVSAMRRLLLGTAVTWLLLCFVSAAADISIRGVAQSDLSKFVNGIDCVPRDVLSPSVATIHVPPERINDDYCDCIGGEDEPGSPGACNSATFFCANSGHRSKYIPSSFVHDHVCDCCDGSDEPQDACANTCSVEGAQARKEATATANAILKGVAERTAMATEAIKLENADRKDIKDLKSQLVLAERKLAETSKRVEKLRTIRDQANKLRDAEAAAAEKRHGEETAPASRMEVSEEDPGDSESSKGDNEGDDFVAEGEGGHQGDADVNDLADGGTPPEDVAVRGDGTSEGNAFANHGEAEAEGDQDSADGATEDLDSTKDSNPDDISDANASAQNDNFVAQPVDEEEVCMKLVGGSVKERMFSAVRYYKGMAVAKLRRVVPGKLLPAFQGDEGSDVRSCVQKAEDAERDARNAKNDLQSKIDDLEKKVARDYGHDKSFRALEGKCFKEKFTQYEFELCIFDRVRQYENGNVIASLGSWGKWKTDIQNYGGMTYENGDQCWNGPQRSTDVQIECGAENRIISVDEPNRCMYKMVFQSPTACTKEQADAILAGVAGDEGAKDEL